MMLQIIGTMIGAYCLARLVETMTGAAHWTTKAAAAAAFLVVALGVLLLFAGDGAAPGITRP